MFEKRTTQKKQDALEFRTVEYNVKFCKENDASTILKKYYVNSCAPKLAYLKIRDALNNGKLSGDEAGLFLVMLDCYIYARYILKVNPDYRWLKKNDCCNVIDESLFIEPGVSWKDFCNQSIEVAAKNYQHPKPKYDYIRLKLGKKIEQKSIPSTRFIQESFKPITPEMLEGRPDLAFLAVEALKNIGDSKEYKRCYGNKFKGTIEDYQKIIDDHANKRVLKY